VDVPGYANPVAITHFTHALPIKFPARLNTSAQTKTECDSCPMYQARNIPDDIVAVDAIYVPEILCLLFGDMFRCPQEKTGGQLWKPSEKDANFFERIIQEWHDHWKD